MQDAGYEMQDSVARFTGYGCLQGSRQAPSSGGVGMEHNFNNTISITQSETNTKEQSNA